MKKKGNNILEYVSTGLGDSIKTLCATRVPRAATMLFLLPLESLLPVNPFKLVSERAVFITGIETVSIPLDTIETAAHVAVANVPERALVGLSDGDPITTCPFDARGGNPFA